MNHLNNNNNIINQQTTSIYSYNHRYSPQNSTTKFSTSSSNNASVLTRQTSFSSQASQGATSFHCVSPTNTFQSTHNNPQQHSSAINTPPPSSSSWSNHAVNNPPCSANHSSTHVNQSLLYYHHQQHSFHNLNTSSPPQVHMFNNGNSEPSQGDLHSPNSNTSQAHSIHLNSQHNLLHHSSPPRQYPQHNNCQFNNSPSSSSTCRFGPSLNNSSCDNMKGLMKASSLIVAQHAEPQPSHFDLSYASDNVHHHLVPPLPPDSQNMITDRYVNIYSPPTQSNSNHSSYTTTNEESNYYSESRSRNSKAATYLSHANYYGQHEQHHASSNIPSIQDWFDKHEHQVINSMRNITRRGSITKIDTTVVSSAGSVPNFQSNQNNAWNDVSLHDECAITPQRNYKFSSNNSQPIQKISKPSKIKKSPQTPVTVVNILGNEYGDFINEGTLVKKKKSIKFKYYTPKM